MGEGTVRRLTPNNGSPNNFESFPFRSAGGIAKPAS